PIMRKTGAQRGPRRLRSIYFYFLVLLFDFPKYQILSTKYFLRHRYGRRNRPRIITFYRGSSSRLFGPGLFAAFLLCFWLLFFFSCFAAVVRANQHGA